MITNILLVVLAALMLLSISLQRAYNQLPLKELKRRARSGDHIAGALYKAAAYKYSLNSLLWALVVISSALFFVLLAINTETWFAVIVSAILIWFGFLWLPAQKTTQAGEWIASKLAPAFAWVLNYLHPVLDRIGGFIRKHNPVHIHTGLYQKEDLIDLINQQQVQADNRISEEELRIATHALRFGDLLIRDTMTPRRVVKTIGTEETVGPVLIDELHKSGFSRFPVHGDKNDEFTGTLYLKDLVNFRKGGKVSKLMSPEVYYVNEEQPLYDALQAFIKTQHHLFVVVNNFEEFVGVITIEDVIEKIIGRAIVDEFDRYDNLRAVAARQAKKTKQQRKGKDVPSSQQMPAEDQDANPGTEIRDGERGKGSLG